MGAYLYPSVGNNALDSYRNSSLYGAVLRGERAGNTTLAALLTGVP